MKPRSLLFRIRTAAAVLIVLALALAGFGLRAMFDSEIESRANAELAQVVKFLAAQARVQQDGVPVLDVAPTDPRFDVAYGGLYWQVTVGERHLRSRSLWDFVLAPPDGGVSGERWAASIAGPNSTQLLAVGQDIAVPSERGEHVLRLIVAVDRADLAAPKRSFLKLLLASLAALGIILIVAMSVFVRLALRPFDQLGRGLQMIHSGQSRTLSGEFPEEVEPVVKDLNRLIAIQDDSIKRARTRAGDLAHGLKTPLAVLAATSREARDKGYAELADTIDEQTSQVQRQVDRALAQARAGASVALSASDVPVLPVCEKIVRALRRLPDTRDLHWRIECAPSPGFPGTEDDLTEMLGNLLDNARKWARSEVRLRAASSGNTLTIDVDDDGPGLPEDRSLNIARGQRWDESRPGSGFGLAITSDLVEGYSGTLKFVRSDLGGLGVRVSVPTRP
jgi:signal transduction histidine kinase